MTETTMKRGTRERLSIEDHIKVAKEIASIYAAMANILKLANGKVPKQILDRLGTGRGVDKALLRLRLDFADELYRVHRAARIYDGLSS